MARGQISRSTYDVFLSFRGEDTRYGFTKYLYDALTQNNIKVFMDGNNLGKGEEIDDVLVKAIEESKIAIVVFSETYASSTWCLDELLKILDCKHRKGQLVIPVFYKVEPTTVRKQQNSYGEAMTIHEDRFKDDIEKVQRWRSVLFKAASISGWDTKNMFEGDLIKDIVKDVSEKLKTLVSNGSHKSQATARPFGVNNDVGKKKQVSAVEDEMYHNWSDMATATSKIMKSNNISKAKAGGKVGNYGKNPMYKVENGVCNSWNRSYVDSSGAVSKVGNHKAKATKDGNNRLRMTTTRTRVPEDVSEDESSGVVVSKVGNHKAKATKDRNNRMRMTTTKTRVPKDESEDESSSGVVVSKVGNHKAKATKDGDNRLRMTIIARVPQDEDEDYDDDDDDDDDDESTEDDFQSESD